MKLILPQVRYLNEFLTTQNNLQGIFKNIARAGRICYASSRQGDESEFVKSCINNGHMRPLEFGTVYLYVDCKDAPQTRIRRVLDHYYDNPYSRVVIKEDKIYITTNYRVIIENGYNEDLQFLESPKPEHIKRHTFHWTISRGIADEFRTHTAISSLMQSTRYCNYSLDKFHNELTFIKPTWVSSCSYDAVPKEQRVFFKALEKAEYDYMQLTDVFNFPAQYARDVLPLAVKTELIQCAYEKDWNQFFQQRVEGTTGVPHPDAKFIAEQAYEYYKLTKSGTKE